MEAILRRTLVEMEKLGIKRVLTHSEKAAAYMADGYARAGNRPGLCMAQSVGAANLAAGLQDACLGHSPVIAFTGRKPPLYQYRNAYQEILHNRMYQPVTKYNVEVDVVEQLPHLMAQAFREATTGAPGPAHLDFLGYEGDLSDEAKAELSSCRRSRSTADCRPGARPDSADLRRAAEALRGASGRCWWWGAALWCPARRRSCGAGRGSGRRGGVLHGRQGDPARRPIRCSWVRSAPTARRAPTRWWPRPTWCSSSGAARATR